MTAYFTFNKTPRPIAMIEGGKEDKRIVYLGENNTDQDNVCCKNCYSGCGFTDEKCCSKCNSCCSMTNDNEYDNIFMKEINKVKKGELPYIDLKDGVMVPIPRLVKPGEEKRENIFISAPEEAGKSTWAANYVKKYLTLYPKSKFFIFSGVDKDAPLDKLKPIRIKLDEKLIDKPIQVNEFPMHSIILFDDVQGISDKHVKKEVFKLRDRLLEKGRHKGLFVLSLNHNPTNCQETRASLLEASSIVLFPRAGDAYHIEKVLKTYLGYNTKNIKDILKLNTRWIQCHKRFPQFILHERGCFFP